MLVTAGLALLLHKRMGQCSGKRLLPMVKELVNTVTLTTMVKLSLSDIRQERMDLESWKEITYLREPMV